MEAADRTGSSEPERIAAAGHDEPVDVDGGVPLTSRVKNGAVPAEDAEVIRILSTDRRKTNGSPS